ncbi:hypothetical protein [Chromobacterium sp. IIBBL 290-4]|uniref:hypothetical protein n=1 Tax=Chromobacterium sp. IIBBL 290-4 TaxID=2953890 RepID=UPI0020B7B1F7|nr:hypothetical protein [Chromobacterium sp. IIBBL 290-4]UTH73456.1 hypothetical protein NKT35_18220 [Chromobacterium sp. IIBBL 290-4]
MRKETSGRVIYFNLVVGSSAGGWLIVRHGMSAAIWGGVGFALAALLCVAIRIAWLRLGERQRTLARA